MRCAMWVIAMVLVIVLGPVLGQVHPLGLGGAALAASGRETGLPIPRFVSLGAEVANLRLGPRRSDPVVAIYRRRGLPLRVVDEEGNWREVVDHEGERGWMHASLLSGRQTAIVTGGPRLLRRGPNTAAPAIARVAPEVVAALLECRTGWCFAEVQGRRGWLPIGALWGADAALTR